MPKAKKLKEEVKHDDVVLPENEQDLGERVAEFNKELQPLLGKYELELAAIPQITQLGTIGAQAVIKSSRKQPEASAPVAETLSKPE
jgi:hypothetical protein